MPPNLLHAAVDLYRRAGGLRRRLLPGLTLANPFEVYLIALVVLGGIPLLLGGPAPVSMAALISRLWTLLWGLELVAGGTMLLVGLARNRSRLRVGGLKTLGWASLAYSVAIVVRLTPGSPAALGYIIGFAVACFAQARHVRRAARALDDYQARLTTSGDPP